MGREGPGGTLAMNENLSFFSIYQMVFKLTDIVADVINQIHP